MLLIYFMIFVFGLIFGSFLNAVIYRTEEKMTLSGRSICPKCKHQIAWYDLVPLFSWLILRGKCRYCKNRISLQYPLVELSTGLIFLLLALQFENQNFSLVNLFFWIFFSFCLIIIFVYDLKHMIIPDEIIYPAMILSLVYIIVLGILSGDITVSLKHLVSGIGAGGFFYFLAEISQGKWMGGGDIKLAGFIGFALGGVLSVAALYTGFILGAFFGLGLIVLRKKEFSSKIPFAPFMISGAFLAFFLSEQINNFYASIMLL